jgi:hypothetical protein
MPQYVCCPLLAAAVVAAVVVAVVAAVVAAVVVAAVVAAAAAVYPAACCQTAFRPHRCLYSSLTACRFFEINKAGYNFAVLRDFYVVHMNHRTIPITNQDEMTERNRVHWWAFKEYLSKHYATKKKTKVKR